MQLECPDADCWQALFGDTVPPGQREDYERHLESCPACQERLDRGETESTALLTLVRQVGDPSTTSVDPALSHALVELHDLAYPERAAATEPIDLYFLQPADRPELLGMLGVYEVREVIGAGGMGVVLAAYEPALHRLVAIKVMAPALAGSALARQRFKREAQAAAAVCHDHIVAVHAVSETAGLPYLVMQYVPGESLQSRLDRSGPLELREILRIGLQTASGLAAAHAQGLIHRDIKPANLLLENGLARVKITDFGLARMTDDVSLTQNGMLAGTPEYMAPEQARGEMLDHRGDLFSLGSALYAMCTGAPPFRGSTTLAVVRRVCDEEPAPIRSLNPDIPEWLESLVARLMAKDPADRIQSATEVAALLEAYLHHLQQPQTTPVPQLPAPAADDCAQVADVDRPTGTRPIWERLCLLAFALFILLALGLAALLAAGAGKPARLAPNLPADIAQDADAEEATPAGPRAALLIGLCSALLLTASLGTVLLVRRRRTSKLAGQVTADAMTAAAVVRFSCRACKKDLKIKAALAGKKARCPQCGTLTLIPQGQPEAPIPRPSQRVPSFAANRSLLACGTAGLILAAAAAWFFWPPSQGKPSLLDVTLGNQVNPEVEESGFYCDESDQFGQSFRWTNGKARLVIPIDKNKPPQAIAVRIYVFRPPGITGRLQILANNHELYMQPHVPHWKWEKAFDLRHLNLGEQLVLDIISDTFLPKGVMDNGTNTDERALGVQVRSIKLLPAFEEMNVGIGRIVNAPLQIWRAHARAIVAGAITADGKTLVSGSGDGTIKIWDVAANRERESLPAFAPNLQALAVSPDGKTFATATSGRVADIWDMETFKLNAELAGHHGQVTALAYSPDGATLAVAAGDRFKAGELKIWDMAAARKGIRGISFKLRLWDAAYAADGKHVAVAGGDGAAQIVDTTNAKIVTSLPHAAYGRRVAITPDGRLLAIAFGDTGDVNVYGVNGGKLAAAFQTPDRKPVATLEFSRDGNRLLAASGGDGVVWDLDRPRARAATLLTGHEGDVSFARFLPDGQTVATGGADGTIRLWNVGKAGHAAPPQTKNFKEYFHSFKDDRDMDPNFDWEGLEPQQCVQFEPAGLRMTFPAGHTGKRVGTGVATRSPIKGDFDITMSYEIIKEPEPEEGGIGTGLFLWVDLDAPQLKRAIVTRAVWGKKTYYTWLHLVSDVPGNPAAEELRLYPVASAATTGRLRLVRTGAVLSHYAAEGNSEEFRLLRQHAFGTEDVKRTVLGGQTGGPQAALDFRVTDVRIRAESLPEFAETAGSEESGAVQWLLVALVSSLILMSALGGWFIIRRRRAALETADS